MEEPALVSSAEDVVAIEPVIRRVVAARVTNPSDVDDLVQDCLERLLGAHRRLAPETVLPYGIVTARNMATSHVRTTARRTTLIPLVADLREPDRPEDMVLVGEAHTAMETALGQLSDGERADVLAYYDAVPSPDQDAREATGAMRVRMARIRAKLRLEYLLAFRHADLPSEQCRRVLLAISAGDTRRQRSLQAGQHLLHCMTCAGLSEPLSKRSSALTVFLVPTAFLARPLVKGVAAAGRLFAKARAHPGPAGASAAAGAAAVATAVVVASGVLSGGRPAAAHPRPSAPPRTAPARAAPAPAIAGLTVGGTTVTARRSMRAAVGSHVDATGVIVQSAVTHDGFWIGTRTLRVWIELVGPLRLLHIAAGDHVRFTGEVTGNGSSYPARAGVHGADAALLSRQGAHIDVETTQIQVEQAK